MKRILAIIMLAITAQAADIVVYPTAAAGSTCGVPKTGQTTSYYANDDGATQIGVARPIPRFSIVGTSDATTNQVKDNSTGLIWARDANILGNMTWTNALDAVAGLSYGGADDWRLPNVTEFLSLQSFCFSPSISDASGTNVWTAAMGPWINVASAVAWWTSTTRPDVPGNALYINLTFGTMASLAKTTATVRVWPVRGP